MCTRRSLLTLITFTLIARAAPALASNQDCWAEPDFYREVHAFREQTFSEQYRAQTRNARAHTVVKWQILDGILRQIRGTNSLAKRKVYYIEPFAGFGMEGIETFDEKGSRGIRAHEGSYLHALRTLLAPDDNQPETVRMFLNFGEPGDGALRKRYQQVFNAGCLLSRGTAVDVKPPTPVSFFPSFVAFRNEPQYAWNDLIKMPGVKTTLAGDKEVVRVIYIDPYAHQISKSRDIAAMVTAARDTGQSYIFIVNSLMKYDDSGFGVDWSWLAKFNPETDLKPSEESHDFRLAKAWNAFKEVQENNVTRWPHAYGFYKFDREQGPVFLTTMWCVNAASDVCKTDEIKLPAHLEVAPLSEAVVRVYIKQNGGVKGLDEDDTSFPLTGAPTSSNDVYREDRKL